MTGPGQEERGKPCPRCVECNAHFMTYEPCVGCGETWMVDWGPDCPECHLCFDCATPACSICRGDG